ncbi:hypothetical protein OG828_07355 [Streptomyces sp. NBC_00457]|uniref:hypothetical protein n=1 Tax=unclassified Streptomyces TaxID=2593676 RepID=UPI002E1C486C|nr:MULTISPECIES: hypothetical protein [unclassified Streptomyces]
MGTSLTPEFWGRFAVLLVAAMGVTFILTAVLDAWAVRLLHRRVRGAPTQVALRSTTDDQSTPGASTFVRH